MKKVLGVLLFALLLHGAYGQHWHGTTIDSIWGSRFRPTDVVMINDSLGYLLGYSRNYGIAPAENSHAILKTTDGGATWDSVRFITRGQIESWFYESGSFFQFNYFKGKLHGLLGHRILVGTPINPQGYVEYGLVEDFLTDMEWDTLLAQRSMPRYNFLTNICPINDSIIICGIEQVMPDSVWFTKIKSHLARFNKKTKTFDTVPIGLPDTLEFIKEIFFVDESKGYVAGGSYLNGVNGYLFHTTDGGHTWHPMKQAWQGMYHCVKFFDRGEGILGGDEEVYFTRNGGFDWYPAIGIPSRFIALDIALAGNAVAYVAGVYRYYSEGRLSHKAQIYKSFDRGKEWCLVYEEELGAPRFSNEKTVHIAAATESRVIVAFPYGRVLYTINGGGLAECVTGINGAGAAISVSVYPNPSNGSFAMALSAPAAFTITDLSGKTVLEGVVEGRETSVAGLPGGLYLLRLQNGQGTYTQKIVVAR